MPQLWQANTWVLGTGRAHTLGGRSPQRKPALAHAHHRSQSARGGIILPPAGVSETSPVGLTGHRGTHFVPRRQCAQHCIGTRAGGADRMATRLQVRRMRRDLSATACAVCGWRPEGPRMSLTWMSPQDDRHPARPCQLAAAPPLPLILKDRWYFVRRALLAL